MAVETDKENIADGLRADLFTKRASVSPKKPTKKTRSKSIGPGGLDAPLKEDTANRRKSAFIPAVKSILASKEDEIKRKEARRKSLANRRVSFAPEATLHTWDVIEYMRDATTSSASSNSTRRASSMTEGTIAQSPQPNAQLPAPSSDPGEPPSTPPEQVEEPLPCSSPANQRDLHQRKRRRRSSGIPPMNFNNPDDAFSSSPYSSSPTHGSDDIEQVSDDGESTAMSLDVGDAAEDTLHSDDGDSTGSSARLDEALRLAAAQAGTQGIGFDENEDVSMEMAGDEITAAFKPWVQKTAEASKSENLLSFLEDQENVNPFSPAFKAHAVSNLAQHADEPAEETEDMSMDITRAVGGIVQYPQLRQFEEMEDATMDLTTAVGGIHAVASETKGNRRGSLKRRRSSTMAPAMLGADAQGSPARRPNARRASLRRRSSSQEESSLEDATMDLTMAMGAIKETTVEEHIERRDSIDTSFGDGTMEFTMIVGGIKESASEREITEVEEEVAQDDNEELSMEFTAVIGGIQKSVAASPKRSSVLATPSPKGRQSLSPRKDSTPSATEISQNLGPSSDPKRDIPATPQKSRQSPAKSIAPRTPENLPQIQDFAAEKENNPSPIAAKMTRSATRNAAQLSTPPSKLLSATEPVQVSPIQVQLLREPLAEKPVNISPQQPPPTRSTSALTDSIKLLSTPRKQVNTSPLKRVAALTPKKQATPKKEPTPRNKTLTPRKSASPKKHVRITAVEASPTKDSLSPADTADEVVANEERIELQDFLNMTKIRFMDLTTSKRRHTAFPSAAHDGKALSALDQTEGAAPDLESCVVAAVCTVPQLEMFQHSCHELKKYISEGKDVVRQIEADTYGENPPLFRDYLAAPLDQRHLIDNQLKNLRTNMRLQSKEIWYGWRSNLLENLKTGLMRTEEDLANDDLTLKQQEALLETLMPVLTSKHERLQAECTQLHERAEELQGCDKEELDEARERLVAADADIGEKKRLIEALQQELIEKERSIEAAKERKLECAEEIKAAERVREECRGWSASEVAALKSKVQTLEMSHGWALTAATDQTVTLTYRTHLQLYFHPSSFNSSTTTQTPNAPISLTYTGADATNPAPLTTTLRFFLQLLRAHLHSLPQSTTPVPALLRLVSGGWDKALAVAGAVRGLRMEWITEESILSDEAMAVRSMVLLPGLGTKVWCGFEVGVGLGGGGEGWEVEVGTRAQVAYGEKYDEGKMAEFLGQFVGKGVKDVNEMGIWAKAVGELKGRLIARGRKG
ncbi:hypothetical protein W97_01742 [Coniosporium apollinis CBS 100218]|uniref:Spc7 kinetochore protein domain-containing protein n=1 Tax=Coniosporium apollinis (strain CBS 100218) TaxID=1168221 RepID=R7YL22_CONA1|nr:uncharacterized protein W97_01742 [Coniosporium apollinis CBS 100218]EON62519.1 hypothetical protein W97_01742 [Coniosporium apollinis CBS 100218]